MAVRVASARMPRFELVIFDNDGVLVDSEPVANAILAELLTGYGLAVTAQDCIERYLGNTLGRVRDLVEAELGHRIPDDFETAYRARCTRGWPSRSRPSLGWPRCWTGSTRPAWPAAWRPAPSTSASRSPSPPPGSSSASRTGCSAPRTSVGASPRPTCSCTRPPPWAWRPTRCAVVEDAPAGVEAANAAGMTAFGYAALTPRRLLVGATGGIVDDMAGLADLLLAPDS